MKTLESMRIGSNRITENGLEHLKGLTNLKRFEFVSDQDSSEMTKGLKHLKDLPKLNEIGVFAPIADTAIDNLKALPNLSKMWLDAGSLTSKGIEKIGDIKFTNLQELSLLQASPKVKDAIDNLKKRLPKVDISAVNSTSD